MNTRSLAAAALLTLACACHSEKTREKIANLESDEDEPVTVEPATANDAQPPQ